MRLSRHCVGFDALTFQKQNGFLDHLENLNTNTWDAFVTECLQTTIGVIKGMTNEDEQTFDRLMYSGPLGLGSMAMWASMRFMTSISSASNDTTLSSSISPLQLLRVFKLFPKLLILKSVSKKNFWISWLPRISKMLGMSLRVESPTISMWTFPPEIVFLSRSSRSVAGLENPQWYK